jgi:hypothetical protein
MKLDPGMHIGLQLVFFGNSGVTDGEGFILQVHDIFTRIRSGDTVVASYGGALGSMFFSTAAVRTGGDSWLDLLGMAANAWGEKP